MKSLQNEFRQESMHIQMAMEQNGLQNRPEDHVVSNIQVKVQPSDSPTKSVSSSELSSSLTTLGLEKNVRFEVTSITDETTFDKIKLKTMNMNFPIDVSI